MNKLTIARPNALKIAFSNAAAALTAARIGAKTLATVNSSDRGAEVIGDRQGFAPRVIALQPEDALVALAILGLPMPAGTTDAGEVETLRRDLYQTGLTAESYMTRCAEVARESRERLERLQELTVEHDGAKRRADDLAEEVQMLRGALAESENDRQALAATVAKMRPQFIETRKAETIDRLRAVTGGLSPLEAAMAATEEALQAAPRGWGSTGQAQVATAPVAAPVAADVVRISFRPGTQGSTLKAAGLTLDHLRNAGFAWHFTDRSRPTAGGWWEAKGCDAARDIAATIAKAGA